jgi:hypothetical protein
VRVLAVAQRLLQLAAEGAPVASVFAVASSTIRDRRIVGGGAGIGLRGEAPAQVQRYAALSIPRGGIDIRAIGADGDEVVLGGGAQHGRAADVDVLDAVVEAGAGLTVASNG